MKPKTLLLFALLIFAQNAVSGMLNELIEQNVYGTARPSRQSIENVQQGVMPRLWIHVRSNEQQKAVSDKLDWFRRIQLNGINIEIRPIQLVQSGPAESQLRFFRKQDKAEAVQLLRELRKILPQLRLQDLSERYKNYEAAYAGHYELWLAPNVTMINAR